jgi:predicted O-linked N-acetylglucosamine transferase (SPINDLY family)
MKMCAWDNLPESIEKVQSKLQSSKKNLHPFYLLALVDDGMLHKKCAEIYTQVLHPTDLTLGVIPKIPKHEKIRIGYFSADFRHHAVSMLTAELFELHDKNQFKTFAFSYGLDDKSPLRVRLSSSFDQFIDVSSMSDLEIAKLARELEIDIAVDLGGFTTDSRTGIFALRAAPVQMSYIGYLGTMGTQYIDYLFADKTIIPEDSKQFYSEKIAYLPSYQVNDSHRKIANKVFTRAELGIPQDSFVFACFNNNYKILPATFEGWMRILKAIEGSVLFLYAENEWAQKNLMKEAEARGIESQRIIFGKHLPADEYLARYQACDLFLDTTPYNAGTTASDALWAGLPVLTLIGNSFASRVAASLLNAIDLPELITTTQSAYEDKAIELAQNPDKLASIKQKLAQNRSSTQLFNTALFTKNIEAVYTKIYQRYQEDLAPDHISIQ